MVFYGKGGIGKSTISVHLAVSYARRGLRVLLFGCDPKADASARLLLERPPPTIIEQLTAELPPDPRALVTRTPAGVDIVETGGPEPGMGCGGRGVATLCQAIDDDTSLFDAYDVIIFDVLGDLVCGGFVAPLRYDFGATVFLVTSEEPASLFAANNIARALRNPANGLARPGGLVFNLREPGLDEQAAARFAAQLGLPLVGVLPRDPLVLDAELEGRTVFDHAPDSDAAARYTLLADAVAAECRATTRHAPRPMERDDFWSFLKDAPWSRRG